MLQLMIDTALFSGIDEKIIREISLFSEVVMFFEGEQAIVEEKAGQHPDMLLLVDGKVNVESKFSPLPTAKNSICLASVTKCSVRWAGYSAINARRA